MIAVCPNASQFHKVYAVNTRLGNASNPNHQKNTFFDEQLTTNTPIANFPPPLSSAT